MMISPEATAGRGAAAGRWRPATGLVAAIAAALLAACSGPHATADTPPAAAPTARATPVGMATVTRATLAVRVSGPGRTEALDLQKVRAPFTGTLRDLRVNIGDHVRAGQVVGAVISQMSEAALTGAQSMLSAATTPAARADAQRALALAQRSTVQAQLRAPRGGVVVFRGASAGDLVTQGDSILGVATSGSVVFVARLAQGDLLHVRAGQRAAIELPGQPRPVPGVVHGILPLDTASLMSVPVRIDLTQGAPSIPPGLFGTVRITVGEHANVPVVPAAALLRNDISGISRIALVTPAGRAHWVSVKPGIAEGDSVEIIAPPLTVGTRVITSGQVGLPDSTPVRATNTSSVAGDSAATAQAMP